MEPLHRYRQLTVQNELRNKLILSRKIYQTTLYYLPAGHHARLNAVKDLMRIIVKIFEIFFEVNYLMADRSK